MTKGSCLILGANGRFGRSCSVQFQNSGWDVSHFDRASQSLDREAQGKDIIVNGWNPGYPNWEKQYLISTDALCRAAEHSGSTIVMPGNVYNYGISTALPWSERTPWVPHTKLGRIRIDIEQRLKRANVQTIVVRSGDYIDIRASGNWFDTFITKPLNKGYISYPGDPNAMHAWGYLPDVAVIAEAMASKRSDLDQYADVLFPGFSVTGNEMAQGISNALGRSIHCKRMSWTALRMLSSFWPMGRCIVSMRYLWDHPHRLSGTLLNELLPDFRATSLHDAMKTVLPYAS